MLASQNAPAARHGGVCRLFSLANENRVRLARSSQTQTVKCVSGLLTETEILNFYPGLSGIREQLESVASPLDCIPKKLTRLAHQTHVLTQGNESIPLGFQI